MATQTTNIPGSGYGNVYLDSLIWGAAWTDIATPIRYWFGEGSTVAPSDLSGVAFDGETWDAPEKDAFIAVTHQYEAVCNLKFVEVGSAADADIVWWKAPGWVMVDSKGIPILAMHQVPDAVNQQINGYFNYETPSWAHLAPGQDGYWTVLHELGHGMGLAHPHDGGSETDATKFPGVRKAFFSDTYTTGTNGLNQTI